LLLICGTGAALASYKSQLKNFYIYIIPLVWITINLCYELVAVIFSVRSSTEDGFNPKSKKKYGIKSFLSIIWRKQ